MKENFFYRHWWLFYLLFFLLLGWLIFALMWHPQNCIAEINDLTKKNVALISETNDLKNKNKSLIKDLEDCRNNPSEAPPAQKTVDCNATVKSGGQGITTTNHRLGKQSGNVVVNFDADNIPDEFKVYYDDKLVASSEGPVSHDGSMNWQYIAEAGKPDFCTVEVSAPRNGTSWEYLVNCPN